MQAASTWDWSPGKRVVADTTKCNREIDWQEELYVSPDGEKFAAVVKVAGEEPEFTVNVNGETWEEVWDRVWLPKFGPDGRLSAIGSTMGEWQAVVDGTPWEENYGYLMHTAFSDDGSVIGYAVQQDMTYGWVVNGEMWENLFENANQFSMTPDGKKTTAVVQVKSLPAAGIAEFKEGVFSVAVNGKVWDEVFVNCWSPVTDPLRGRTACTVRTSLYDYTIAIDGKVWDKSWTCAWEPVFNPINGKVAAPVRIAGRWAMALEGEIIWEPDFAQIWHHQFSADGKKLYAIVAPTYGHWTVAVDGKSWGTTVNKMVRELAVSPDGERAAVCAKNDDKWGFLVDGQKWGKSYEMTWAPVFSSDSASVAAKVELPGKRFTVVVNGKQYGSDFDECWNPIFSPEGDKVLIRAVEDGKLIRIVVPVNEF